MRLSVTFSLVYLILVSGCASITQGTIQTVIFNLEPKQTKCTAQRDGDGELGTITSQNNTLSISKSKNDIVVKCSAKGYASKTLRMMSATQANGVVGGVFLDLGIVDMATGAMWKYENAVTIALDKE